jgi:translation initiation factor 6
MHMKRKVPDEHSRLQLLHFNENPNVGVFCRTNETIAFVRKGLSSKIKRRIQSALDVSLVELSIADASIVGSLLTLNSTGAIVTDFADQEALDCIEQQDLAIHVIQDTFNAAGNDILLNDKGAMVHPSLSDESLKAIEKTCGVPVTRGTIGDLETVGMAAVVTNKGLLCHPKVTPEEKRRLEEVFDVEVMIGTVNHGVPLIGSGLVANSKGALIGSLTTGIEMGRIEEALHLLE